jgi:hypothetical protein
MQVQREVPNSHRNSTASSVHNLFPIYRIPTSATIIAHDMSKTIHRLRSVGRNFQIRKLVFLSHLILIDNKGLIRTGKHNVHKDHNPGRQGVLSPHTPSFLFGFIARTILQIPERIFTSLQSLLFLVFKQ